MIRRVMPLEDDTGAAVAIRDAAFPAPFRSGLEYGAPARGPWNIVHVGMLLPEAHEIFVCASNCLRGVVLTAAEMGAQDRFSTVTIKENNVLDGDMEDLIVEGVSDVLNRLPKTPPAALVYLSCIHHFMGCDIGLCFRRLRGRFPETDFTDCYMNPIMRKSGLTPDQLMRRQLYSLIRPQEKEEKTLNLIGNCFPTQSSSDLVKLVRQAGWKLRDVTLCGTYEEYQEMGKSVLNISYNPAAKAAGDALERRLSQRHLFLPLSYGSESIRKAMGTLADALGTAYDPGQAEAKAEAAITKAKKLIGDMPIAVDYTAATAPLSLVRLLLEHGFRVERVYADSFGTLEEGDFHWLQEHAPDLKVFATVQVKLRVLPRQTEEPMLAIGQKAAYFTGSRHFVNMVEGGGLYGFDGIEKLMGLLEEAFLTERDPSRFIQQKGLGCACCL